MYYEYFLKLKSFEFKLFFQSIFIGILLFIFSKAITSKGFVTSKQQYDKIQDGLIKNKHKILCLCLTHPSKEKMAESVINTWGKRCDKILFITLPLSINVSTINLTITSESREMLWEKMRQAFQYAYDHHLNEYDWFLKADDDTYVIMENLRQFLSRYNSKKPYYFGRRFKIAGGYNSGGAAYVLSRKALELFIHAKNKFRNACSPGTQPEDLAVGQCLAVMKVAPTEARDKFNKEIFQCFSLTYMLHESENEKPYWIHSYNYYPYYVGRNCCSTHTSTFHYTDENNKYILDFLLYNTITYKNQSVERTT